MDTTFFTSCLELVGRELTSVAGCPEDLELWEGWVMGGNVGDLGAADRAGMLAALAGFT